MIVPNNQIIESYNEGVGARIARYESLVLTDYFPEIEKHLPEAPAKIIDIGAGSGRDAAYFASLGHDVTAVEPAEKLLAKARKIHSVDNIAWVADRLPFLKAIPKKGQFDLVFISAVWMHLSEKEQQDSLDTVKKLMKPCGKLIITYKIGGDVAEGFNVIDASHFDRDIQLAGLSIISCNYQRDSLNRPELKWRRCVLKFLNHSH